MSPPTDKMLMLEVEILVAEQSTTHQLKWLRDLSDSTLARTVQDGRSDRRDPISWLVRSSTCTFMIVLTVIFKLLL